MIRNPPYFAWTLQSAPGHYHGFLWFYVVNEQLLRFLNLRYPRDYNTVPRLYFWLLHLVWLFPWSTYLPGICRLSFLPSDVASRTRLLALCWIAVVLIFFTFSTTQEYYSMPCYPAFALLLSSTMTKRNSWVTWGTRILTFVLGAAAITVIVLLFLVHRLPAPSDISAALSSHPQAYSLSLGHMQDLTLASLAYLRAPLTIAGVALLTGVVGTLSRKRHTAYVAIALMMVIFFQGARLAMVRFDPLLSSRELADRILRSPPGQVVVDHHYYTFSSIAFYTGLPELLLNGRWNNFEYGSNAPGAANVFINDDRLKALWSGPVRLYLVARTDQLPRFDALLGAPHLYMLENSGGKMLLTNQAASTQ
jgi:hypothetical protein